MPYFWTFCTSTPPRCASDIIHVIVSAKCFLDETHVALYSFSPREFKTLYSSRFYLLTAKPFVLTPGQGFNLDNVSSNWLDDLQLGDLAYWISLHFLRFHLNITAFRMASFIFTALVTACELSLTLHISARFREGCQTRIRLQRIQFQSFQTCNHFYTSFFLDNDVKGSDGK